MLRRVGGISGLSVIPGQWTSSGTWVVPSQQLPCSKYIPNSANLLVNISDPRVMSINKACQGLIRVWIVFGHPARSSLLRIVPVGEFVPPGACRTWAIVIMGVTSDGFRIRCTGIGNGAHLVKKFLRGRIGMMHIPIVDMHKPVLGGPIGS